AASGSSLASRAPGGAQRASSACSGATRTPHAPAASAWAAKRPPSARSPGRPTNRSPWVTSRESTTARRGPSRRGAGCTRRAPDASARRSGDQACTQRLPGDVRVVEGDLVAAGELLPLLVALAGDDDHVAVGGQRDGSLDRGATV